MPPQIGAVISALGNFLGGVGNQYPNPALPGSAVNPNVAGPAAGVASGQPGVPIGAMQDVGGGGGAGFGLRDLLSLGSVVGKTIEAYRNYQLQQNLQNPNYIANQIAKLEQREAPALIAAEGPSIAGQYGEAGLAGAPGLIAQGISSAITPQLISDASSNYFSGLSASEGIASPSSGLADLSALFNDVFPGS